MISGGHDAVEEAVTMRWIGRSGWVECARYHLLSLCGLANTHSEAGRMVLMNLANYNQFEREMISERTRDALQHMKSQRCWWVMS